MHVSPGDSFFPPGTLAVGVNYWASHAGIFMWRDWQPDVVASDFDQLARAGIRLLRVFPLWPDFQPVASLRKWHSRHVEYRTSSDESPLAREDGMCPVMLDRFGLLADLAAARKLTLIVSLVTGWMSGRLFVPPALERLNPVTDPEAIQWQLRFVRAFVTRHREHPAIRAWDLGNECNCMGSATRQQAWVWTAALASSVRAADPTRPVISGMHSLKADPSAENGWTIRDQGELTDILTTHPYPLFTPHCAREPADTLRPLLHAAAETCLYADLSGRPAMVEEFGTLGPTVCDEATAARVARITLFDTWAHDARAALWWCAWDQSHLDAAPYDWLAIERELGLFRVDGSPKPALHALAEACTAIASLPLPGGRLPPRRIDAVCLLTAGQDHWAAAFTAFILAKQAGFDLRFHYADRPLPPASLYLLPSVKGRAPLSRQRERELWARIEAGSTLYLSLDDGGLGELHARTGLTLRSTSQRSGDAAFEFAGSAFSLPAPCRYEFTPVPDTRILAREGNETPVFLQTPCQRGSVFILLAPLETALATRAEAFSPAPGSPHQAFWQLYATFAASRLARRVLGKTSPWIGLTEHPADDGRTLVVATNYSPDVIDETFVPACSQEPDPDWPAPSLRHRFAPASSVVFCLRPKRCSSRGSQVANTPGTAEPQLV
ncbi:endo-beta-mannanase [Opitutaceae bacterium TAV1]|nr:endo-beta-mannanase [Opitutaceae bacterium TAV1]